MVNLEKKKKRRNKSDLGSSMELDSPATNQSQVDTHQAVQDMGHTEEAGHAEQDTGQSEDIIEEERNSQDLENESLKDVDLAGSELSQQESLNEPQFFKRNKSAESVYTEDEWTVVEKPKQMRIISGSKPQQPKAPPTVKQEITKKQKENQQKALKLKLLKQEQDELQKERLRLHKREQEKHKILELKQKEMKSKW
ncbi:hypothetical protein HDV01_001666 [Terramyces sp. JEL0728]|nr:hypothetical protein HDV01_001666 [Terramyces sp. JEL0728]